MRASSPRLLISVGLLLLAGAGKSAGQPDELEALVAQLEDASWTTRSRAANALVEAGTSAVPLLAKALEGGSEDARGMAHHALSQLGGPAVPALVEATTHERWEVRRSAFEALSKINPKPPRLSPLRGGLSDSNAEARAAAAWALQLAGPAAAPALPELLEAATDADPVVRRNALGALGALGPGEAKRTVPVLAGALEDEDWMVAPAACYALQNLGPAAAPAVPALEAALESRRAPWGVVDAFNAIGEPAVLGLVDALSSDNEWTVRTATKGLRELGIQLKLGGDVLWWVVPYAYRWEAAGLAVLGGLWFLVMGRFPRRRPRRIGLHRANVVLTAAPLVGVACWGALYAMRRPWAEGFLPDAVTLVPLPVAVVLTVGAVTALPAVWVQVRKRPAARSDDPPPLASGTKTMEGR